RREILFLERRELGPGPEQRDGMGQIGRYHGRPRGVPEGAGITGERVMRGLEIAEPVERLAGGAVIFVALRREMRGRRETRKQLDQPDLEPEQVEAVHGIEDRAKRDAIARP